MSKKLGRWGQTDRDAQEQRTAGTLTVAAVAQRLGVAPPTLRTWARRYGVGPSDHSAGAHRRYSSDDVARLMVMRRLILEGVAPSDAAKTALTAALNPGSETDDGRPEALISVETAPDSPPERGRSVSLPDDAAHTRELARSAMALDTYETHRILRKNIHRHGVVPTWDRMIRPVLRGLGERVRVTGEDIDVVHAFAEDVLGVFREAAFDLRYPYSSPTVLLACADEDHHSVPLHALAAALAEHDVPTRMLGTGLPPHAVASSSRRTKPAVVVLFARMPGADASDAQVLRRQRPAPTVILAGPGWLPETVPAGARTVGSLGGAVDEVLRGLRP